MLRINVDASADFQFSNPADVFCRLLKRSRKTVSASPAESFKQKGLVSRSDSIVT